MRRLVWHRRDLRLNDNWLYSTAVASDEILSLYILEDFQKVEHQGPFALRGLLEALHDLARNLQRIGGQLLVQRNNNNDPVELVKKIVREYDISVVCWNEEPGVYECQLSRAMKAGLELLMVRVQTDMQYTLYHPNDLPYGHAEWDKLAYPDRKSKTKHNDTANEYDFIDPRRWNGMCPVMGDFRRAAQRKTTPRDCTNPPTKIKGIPMTNGDTHIPSFEELCREFYQDITVLGIDKLIIQSIVEHAKTVAMPKMGETEGLAHLEHFLKHKAATAARNLADVSNFQSSRLSGYLAFGCLSPRQVYHRASELQVDWLTAHMTMRDFFLFLCLSSGSKFYALEGLPVRRPKQSVVWKTRQSNPELWRRWALGQTGFPLVDAAMRELQQTGYCSNRVRQNAASFLTKDLQIDWRAGASWFQFLLHDHCVGANWGNWLYFSGVGPDPKQRHFRTVSQALRYDADGTYVRRFVPELSNIHADEGHLRPWDFSEGWIDTLVSVETQYTFNDLKNLRIHGRLQVKDEDACMKAGEGAEKELQQLPRT